MGPLPANVCWTYTSLTNAFGFCMITVSDEIIFLKLLYASVWKNVGDIDEDFVMFFTKTHLLIFTGIYLGKKGVYFSW